MRLLSLFLLLLLLGCSDKDTSTRVSPGSLVYYEKVCINNVMYIFSSRGGIIPQINKDNKVVECK